MINTKPSPRTWFIAVLTVLIATFAAAYYSTEYREVEAPAYAFITQEYPQGSMHFRQIVQDAMDNYGKITQKEYHAIFKDRLDAKGAISIPMKQDREQERKALLNAMRGCQIFNPDSKEITGKPGEKILVPAGSTLICR